MLFLISFLQILIYVNKIFSQILVEPEYYNGSYPIPRVVNGWPAVLGDVPYQLSFKMRVSAFSRRYASFCGGTIISPEKFVSAAHCFENTGSDCVNLFSSGPVRVRKKVFRHTYAVAGNLYNRGTPSDPGQWRKVKSILYPKKYKFPKNDIAVGLVEHPFDFNSHINSIPIAVKHINYVGKCLVSGYGRISQRQTSPILLLAHLKVLSMGVCNQVHFRDMTKFVCTSDTISDVGKGDSGGPLVCSGTGDPNDKGKGVLVGVVSGNRKYCGSFFTRVSNYADFITQNGSHKLRLQARIIWINCIILYAVFFLF